MKMIRFGVETIFFKKEKYQADRSLAICIMCEDGPYATLSTYLEGQMSVLDSDEFFCKTYSENERVFSFLLEKGYIELTGKVVDNGYMEFPSAKLSSKANEFIIGDDL